MLKDNTLFNFIKETRYPLIFIGLLTILYTLVALCFSPASQQTHFVDQANAFLHGQTYLVKPIRLHDDVSVFHNNYFVYFGLIPPLILLPFVFLLGLDTPQASLTITAGILSFILLYKLCKTLGMENKNHALWLSIFFTFGTMFAFLVFTPTSAYAVQIIGCACLLAALYVFLEYQLYFLAGLLVSLAGMTRPTLYLAAIFFFIELLRSKPVVLKKLLVFISSIITSIIIQASYNYIRFHNPLETGYGYIVSANPIFNELRRYGVFNFAHVAGNLYLLLLKGPEAVRTNNLVYILKFPYLRANEWGMGIFFTSPIFLYLYSITLKAKYVLSSLVTVLIMLIPILTYYNSGLWQYGYRYALDFYPFLYIMLVIIFRIHLPKRAIFLICCSAFFNLFFMYSIWDIYPILK